jgi:hypothetical protein
MAEGAAEKDPGRRRWRVEPEEIPPELRDNSFVQYLTTLTPEDEALFDHLAQLDRREYEAEQEEQRAEARAERITWERTELERVAGKLLRLEPITSEERALVQRQLDDAPIADPMNAPASPEPTAPTLPADLTEVERKVALGLPRTPEETEEGLRLLAERALASPQGYLAFGSPDDA